MAYRGIILMIHVSNEEGKGKKMQNPPTPPFTKKTVRLKLKLYRLLIYNIVVSASECSARDWPELYDKNLKNLSLNSCTYYGVL